MRHKNFSSQTPEQFSFAHRGQMLLFYALMIPVMLLFIGLALDLGWYYLNVSRLQNAADAAALAGAKALMTNDENFSEFKYTWLADNYSGNKDTTIDTSISDAAAQSYANKNLSGNDTAAPITDELTDTTVAHAETLYQDDEIKSETFYYVVQLEENVQHFFLPGFFGKMSAPVVAVATISKVSNKVAGWQEIDPDDPDNPSGDDPNNPSDPDNPDDPPLPNIEDITGDEDDDDPDEPENPPDPTTPTKTDEEIQQEEEQKKIEEGLSIYGAMKGNPDYDRKSLEEQMTYNTWWAIYKLGKDSAYCVYPDGGGSVYSGKSYRTETTYINSSEVSAKKNNFTLFLDLGSDLMYEDSSGKGGLFNTSWDLANIATDGNGDTLTSIKANANSGKLSSGTLTISSDGNTNNVYGYYSGSGWWKSLVDKLKFNFKNSSSLAYTDAVKYRVHTSFNFDAVFPVRSNKNTSPKYVNGYAVPATDPLYVRIESEELNEADGDKQNTTARQMFININADNTASNARPLIIFYEGPDRGLKEGYDDADVEGSTQTQSPKDSYPNLTRRTAQPVVLNLQADFKGILFAPSSPVIIKGNGHKMEGFVVAKNFIDFADRGDVRVTENGLTFYTDYYGNIQTKSLAAGSIRKLSSNEQPLPSEASEFKKKYYATYEFAYNLSAFNLSDDSFYSSFDIPELERTVYTYLDNYKYINKADSVDMIFTTIRSKWIT